MQLQADNTNVTSARCFEVSLAFARIVAKISRIFCFVRVYTNCIVLVSTMVLRTSNLKTHMSMSVRRLMGLFLVFVSYSPSLRYSYSQCLDLGRSIPNIGKVEYAFSNAEILECTGIAYISETSNEVRDALIA